MSLTFAEFEKVVAGFGEPNLPISPLWGLSACVGQLSSTALEAAEGDKEVPEAAIQQSVLAGLAGILIFSATLARGHNLTLASVAELVKGSRESVGVTIEEAPE